MPNPSTATNPLDYPKYVRGIRPSDPASLALWVEDELEKIMNAEDNQSVAVVDEVSKQFDAVAITTSTAIGDEVAARIAAVQAEADARSQALLDEAAARGSGIFIEKQERLQGDADVRAYVLEVVASGDTGSAAIKAETDARIAADLAEAAQRTTLAAQLRGTYTGNDLTQVTTGFAYDERIARSTADAAEASARTILSTKVTGLADPSSATLSTLSSGLLFDERAARSTADATEVVARQALSTKVLGTGDPSTITGLPSLSTGLIFEEKSLRTSGDASNAQAISDLATVVTNGDTTNSVAISNEAQARSTAIDAVGSRIDTLTANTNTAVGSLTSSIQNETNARTSAVQAEASARDALRVTLQNADTSLQGQINNKGLKFFVRANGLSSGNPKGPAGIYFEDGQTVSGPSKVYVFAVRYPDGHWDINSYDTYNDPNGTPAFCNRLQDYLNTPSTYGYPAIVYTCDEPSTNRSPQLISLLQQFGAGPVFADPNWNFRSAYILIGEVNCGKNGGRESYRGDTQSTSWLNETFTVFGNTVDKANSTAAVSSEQTARVAADAANASLITSLSAKVRVGAGAGIITNPTFGDDGWGGTTNTSNNPPPGWSIWANDGGAYIGKGKASPLTTGNSLQLDRNGTNCGVIQAGLKVYPGKWIMEVECAVGDGSASGGGVLFRGAGAGGDFDFGFNSQAAVDGTPPGTEKGYGPVPTYGTMRKYTYLFDITGSSDNAQIYLTSGYVGIGGYTGFSRYTYQSISLRPATGYEAAAAVNTASIQTEQTVRASAVKTVADSLTSLTTTVGGNTSTITNQQTSINGLSARVGLKLDVNGRITGWVLNNDGASDSIKFTTSNFAVYDPSFGDKPVFQIIGGVTYLNLPVPAANVVGTVPTTQSVTINGPGASPTISKLMSAGQSVEVVGQWRVAGPSSASLTLQYQDTNNNWQNFSGTDTEADSPGTPLQPYVVQLFTNPYGAERNINFRALCSSNGGAGTTTYASSYLKV